MAGLNLPSLKIDILADGSSAIREIDGVVAAAASIETVGTKMKNFATTKIVGALKSAVSGASDLAETLGKTEVIFGSMTDDVIAWSETSIDKMGLAQGTALEMTALYADMATGMGFTVSEAKNMSTEMVQLAADLASFKNIGIEDVQTKLNGVFTGETEGLKSLGVVMTQANLQQYALTQGITKQVSAMTQAEQVQLRYSYLMSQTANAQGDFARTGDSLANQSRKLSETAKQLGASFGQLLTGKIAQVVGKLQSIVQGISELDSGTKEAIITVGLVVAAVGPLLIVVGKIVTAVSTLKVALGAMMASPITLAIMGVTAAAGLLATAVMNANKEVDRTSASYKKMEDIVKNGASGKVTVDDSQVATAAGPQGEIAKLKAKIADLKALIALETDPAKKAALETELSGLEDRLAELKGSVTIDGTEIGDRDKEVSDLKGKIDDLKAKIALETDPAKKAALETELSDLKTKLAELDGSVTIDGSEIAARQAEVDELKTQIADLKAKIALETDPAKKAALETELSGLEDRLADLKGEHPVSVSASFEEKDKATQKMRNFLRYVDQLPKDENYGGIGKFNVEGSTTEDINAYAGALAHAATATSDYASAVDKLNDFAEQEAQAKIGKLNEQTAQQMQTLKTLRASGVIDDAEYYEGWNQLLNGFSETTKAIEAEKKAVQEANGVFDNGTAADDYKGAADNFYNVGEAAELSAETINSAIDLLGKAYESGEDMSDLKFEGFTAIAGLMQQQTAAADEARAAIEAYNAAMAKANADEASGIAGAEREVERLKLMSSVFEDILVAESEGNSPAEAMKTAFESNRESLDQFPGLISEISQEMTDSETGELAQYFDVLDMLESSEAMLADAETEAQETITKIQQDAEHARSDAETALGERVGAIAETFSPEKVESTIALAEAAGAEIEAADAQLVTGTAQMIENIKSALSGGSGDVTAAVDTLMSALDGAADTAGSGGEDAGRQFGAGMASGINQNTGGIKAAARAAALEAVRAAKAALVIQSPSHVARDEIGAMFTRGMAQGVTNETKTAVNAVRNSVRNMVNAAKSIDVSGFTAPFENSMQALKDKVSLLYSGAVPVTPMGVPILPAGAAAGSQSIQMPLVDYDRMADAMSRRPISFSVGSRQLTSATRDEAARQQAVRVAEINAGYGGGR